MIDHYLHKFKIPFFKVREVLFESLKIFFTLKIITYENIRNLRKISFLTLI